MDAYLDFELFQYLDAEAEQEIPLKELLLRHHLSDLDAKRGIQNFRVKFQYLLGKYGVRTHNAVAACYDLAGHIRHTPANLELQFLYFCILTDRRLLSDNQQTGEQAMRNYIQQQDSIQCLTRYTETYRQCRKKLELLKAALRNPVLDHSKTVQDSQMLFELVTQHLFLYGSAKNNVFRANLENLNTHLESTSLLRAAKPYLLFALLSRKHGMMLHRMHYIPNLLSALVYQDYQINTDNGKNFSQYQSYVELYEHLRRAYLSDPQTDIPFCDYCFANLSPLSEWFYRYCLPEQPIPKNLKQTIQEHMALSFPTLLDYEKYAEYDIAEFEAANPAILKEWEKTANNGLTEALLDALYHGQDTDGIVEQLPRCHSCLEYAAIFLYGAAENHLAEKMLMLTDEFE